MPGREEAAEEAVVCEAVGEQIVDLLAKHFPDDSKYALCLRLQYAVPLIRNQERQRIQEALLSDKAIWAAGARLPGSEHDSAEDWAKEAIEAALDTLDPSGEEKVGTNSRRESELLQLLKEAEEQRDKARKEREEFASREIERIAQYMDLADCVFSRNQIKAASDDDLHAALKSQLLKSRIAESHPSGETDCETCDGWGEASTEGQVWQDGQCTDCQGTGKKPATHPSGEQGEDLGRELEAARDRIRDLEDQRERASEEGCDECEDRREAATAKLAKVRAELQHRADQAAAIIGMASPESELRARHEEQALRAAISFIDDADHFPNTTRTGHEIGAIYENLSLGGGAYLVLGETDTGEVEVEQVVKGTAGEHYIVGTRWTHYTHVDHTDRRVGFAAAPATYPSKEVQP
jgi:hypothetical protein